MYSFDFNNIEYEVSSQDVDSDEFDENSPEALIRTRMAFAAELPLYYTPKEVEMMINQSFNYDPDAACIFQRYDLKRAIRPFESYSNDAGANNTANVNPVGADITGDPGNDSGASDTETEDDKVEASVDASHLSSCLSINSVIWFPQRFWKPLLT